MGKIELIKSMDGKIDYFGFYCPGCGHSHMVPINDAKLENGHGWQFDGNKEAPTLSPSLLTKSGHYATHFNPEKDTCWCSFKERTGDEPSFKCGICHLFVRDGKIEYLSDCTHEYAGKTIDMVDFPKEDR